MKMKTKNKRGFTLVETISAIMLMSMVGVILAVIFNTMFASQGLIDREATIQAEMRTSMQTVDKTVEKATAIFILDDSKYTGSKANLTKEWSYIGLSGDGKKILNYSWNKDKKDWDVQELGVKSPYELTLDLTFKTDDKYQDNRVVKYNLTGKYKNSNNKLGIDTSITALNTKQIFSKVAKGKKGVAIAYRNDPIEGRLNIAVSFVFDTSGSMSWGMSKENPYTTGKPSRMTILKEKSKILVDDLAAIGGVSVNLIEFNSLGKYVQEDFVNLDTGTSTIYKKIDGLVPDGGTNPGDGLRYSLLSLQKNSAQLKYVVLLSDGVPNIYTKKSGGESFDLSDVVGPNASKRYFYKNNNALPEAIEYTGLVMDRYGSGIRRVSVIGFSAIADEISQGQTLTNRIGRNGVEADYTEATSQEKLQEVFSKIKKQIEQDKWFVSGP